MLKKKFMKIIFTSHLTNERNYLIIHYTTDISKITLGLIVNIPRWKRIADAIGADIHAGNLPTGTVLPTETELALQWNVSRMTAHHALHELSLDGLVTRKRRSGTIVADNRKLKTERVAVFLNTHDFLEQQYVCGIRSGLPDEYDLLYCDIRGDSQREAQYLNRMSDSADGIICLPTCDPQNNELISSVISSGVRIVCLDCVPDNVKVDAVISDNYGGTLDALHYLVDRGHRRIAHFTVDRFFNSSLRERNDAYQEVMNETGETDVQRWLRKFPYEMMIHSPGFPIQAVQDALYTLLNQPEPPTALFCAHDYVLSAALQACETLGITIPTDLEIVSFNDCPPLIPYLPGGVHRIIQCASEMGQKAAEHLWHLLHGAEGEPEVIRVAANFISASV